MARLLILWLGLCISTGTPAAQRWQDDAGTQWPPSAESPSYQRWVVLGPHLVDMVTLLGGGSRIVGVQDDHPTPGRRSRSRQGHVIIGQPGQVNEEQLRRVRPDLVVYWPDGLQAQQVARLHRLNVPLLAISPRRLEDIPERLVWLGHLLQQDERARRLADTQLARLRHWRQRYQAGRRLRGFYQLWSQPLYSLAPDHLVSQALAVCGVDSIVPPTALAAPVVSREHVLRAAPDVILVPRPLHASARALWQRHPSLPAVRHGAILALDDTALTRPGLALLQAIPAVCEQLQPWRRPAGMR